MNQDRLSDTITAWQRRLSCKPQNIHYGVADKFNIRPNNDWSLLRKTHIEASFFIKFHSQNITENFSWNQIISGIGRGPYFYRHYGTADN